MGVPVVGEALEAEAFGGGEAADDGWGVGDGRDLVAAVGGF